MGTPYFIVNPTAGGGRAADRFLKVRQLLDSRGTEYRFVLTEHPRHSIELAEAAYAAGERLIVAVGGDGTLSETASVLYTKQDVVMGMFPFGTGNDIAKALGLPTEPEAAVELLLSGSQRRMDIGLANEQPFINVAGLGFDVDVLVNTERFKKRFHGMLPYVFGILRTMFHLNRIPAKVTANGEVIETTMLLCAVGNGTHIGGGMAVTPNADPYDGLFDVCLVRSVNIFTFVALLPSFIKGKHVNKKPCTCFRTSQITVECAPTLLDIDGEVTNSSPVTFKNLQSALTVIAPQK